MASSAAFIMRKSTRPPTKTTPIRAMKAGEAREPGHLKRTHRAMPRAIRAVARETRENTWFPSRKEVIRRQIPMTVIKRLALDAHS
ncbi:MAG: hypothetical protein ACLFUV_06640 [Methanomassiliicoccales archaeon]